MADSSDEGKQHGPWVINASKKVYADPWITVQRDEVTRPDGAPGSYATVQLKSGGCVLAIDDERNLKLTREFHYAVGRDTIEGVSGGIEDGETAIEAAKRELLEETGLIADHLYSADFIETYFDARHDAIFMAPVFVAVVENEQNVKLSDTEHDQFKWLDVSQALGYLDFAGQRNALTHIKERFMEREPSEHLLIL